MSNETVNQPGNRSRREQWLRGIAIIGVSIAAGAVAWQSQGLGLGGELPADFLGRSVIPAREILHGLNPYAHQFTYVDVPYPLPAMFLGLPFTPLSDAVAGALFVALTSGLLVYALTQERKYWRLFLLGAYPFWESAHFIQFAPLMALSILLPMSCALPLTLIKPQAALAGVAMQGPNRKSIVITVIILGISLIALPDWPLQWLRSAQSYRSLIPILAPLGFVLILPLLGWRVPKWRGLLALSVLPKHGMYDHLYVGMLAQNGYEAILYMALSWLPLFYYDAFILMYIAPLVVWGIKSLPKNRFRNLN